MPTTAAFAVSVAAPTRHSWMAMTGAPARRISASRRACRAGRRNGLARFATAADASTAWATEIAR